MQNYTNNIPEWKNDTLLQKFSQKQNPGKKTQHTMYKKQRKKPTHHEQEIDLIITPSIASKKRQNNNAAETDKCKEPPPREVAIERCSEHSVTLESIGIGEFGMRMSRKGNMTTFNLAIRESLFPMVKFLGGTKTSLDYSTEPTSICGLLRKHCNIANADARLW